MKQGEIVYSGQINHSFRASKIIVDNKAKYTDWSYGDDIKAELKMDLILVFTEHSYPPLSKGKDEVFKEILKQAENFKSYSKSTANTHCG
ncbi:MAG: DUF3387 domain-containing protein [Bacteroidales bacterium]|nr:DUF3387 domain-containing protein [Bacteroidales bacterium]